VVSLGTWIGGLVLIHVASGQRQQRPAFIRSYRYKRLLGAFFAHLLSAIRGVPMGQVVVVRIFDISMGVDAALRLDTYSRMPEDRCYGD